MKIEILKVDYKTPLEKQLKELGIKNYLSLDYLKDLHELSQDSCLYDVEDGEVMLNISPLDARDKFTKEGRQGLTVREGLALYRYDKKILKRHFLVLVGARFCGGSVPCLGVGDGEPALCYDWEGNAGPKCGAPSASSVLKLGTGELGSLEFRVLELEKAMSEVNAWKTKLTDAWNGK